MVTLDPLAVSVPVKLLFDPTVTEPKLRLPGETESCPGAALEPDNPMFNVGLGASEVIVTSPLALAED